MKKLIMLLVVLMSWGVAQDLYFSNDTIGLGWGREHPGVCIDTFYDTTTLVNNSDDTLIIDSVTVDSISDSDIVIYKDLDVNGGIFFKSSGDTTSKKITPNALMIPNEHFSIRLDANHYFEGWQNDQDSISFNRNFIVFWLYETYHTSVGDIPLTLAGYWYIGNGEQSISDFTSNSMAVSSSSLSTTPIYNARGQVIAQNGTKLNNHLANTVLLQKKSKFVTPSSTGVK